MKQRPFTHIDRITRIATNRCVVLGTVNRNPAIWPDAGDGIPPYWMPVPDGYEVRDATATYRVMDGAWWRTVQGEPVWWCFECGRSDCKGACHLSRTCPW